ncbi:MAG: hypothetical protein ACO1OB_28755 [Archangium sp.]
MRVWLGVMVVASGCATILRSTSEASPLPVLPCSYSGDSRGPSHDDILNGVRDRKEQLNWCVQGNAYDSARVTYMFVWDVTPDGRVENVGVNRASIAGEPLAHCVVDEIGRMRFAKTELGAKGVCFPMKF